MLWIAGIGFYLSLHRHPPADDRPSLRDAPHRCGCPRGRELTGMTAEAGSTAAPTEVEQPETDEIARAGLPWLVIVWNDPINLMSYVTYVFQKLFGYSAAEGSQAHARRPLQGSSRGLERAQGAGRARCRPAPPARALGDDGAQRVSFRRRIRPARGGGYELRLPTEERDLLAALPASARLVARRRRRRAPG